jgi:hypothetical protein
MGNELKVQNSLVVAGPAIISGSLTTIGGLVASGSFNVTGSLNITNGGLSVYSSDGSKFGSITTDNTFTYLNTNGGIGTHIRMYNVANTTQFLQDCNFLNGASVQGSPWYGYVLSLAKASYPANDYLRWEVGKINSSGSFGIGTLTPSASLHISGANSNVLLRIDSPASSSILFVSGSGNIGIGTITPSAKLDISGSIRIRANSSLNSDFSGGVTNIPILSVDSYDSVVLGSTYAANGLVVLTSGIRYDLKASGLGINTASPGASLHVKGSGTTSSTTALLVQNSNASASFQIKDNSEVVFATPDYTPNDGSNVNYLSKTRTGIYVANTANNFGISYEGGRIYSNIGHGSSNPILTPSINTWTSNVGLNALSLVGTNGLFTSGIDKFVAPTGGTDLTIIFAGSTNTSGQGRIIAYGETHAPKKGKLELYSGTDPLYGVISFSPGNTEAARFTPDGRLNIGAITGSAKVLISGSSNSTLLEIDSPAVNNILYVSGSGNVGIGTSTPTSTLHVSGSTYIYKSGSTVLDIQGSQGQLFSVVDTLSGSLMSVNDVSGLPILEVFSDDRVVLGTYGAPALIITGSNAVFTGSVVIDGAFLDTVRTGSLATGSTLIYTVNTGSYQAGFFDYYINSGSNFRAGNIMAVFGAGTYRFTDAATPDIGNTTNLQFSMSMAGASAQLFASASTAGWTVKTTFRTI